MALEREKATYWAKLPELATSSEGKFVVIHGDDVAGLAEGYEEALRIGYSGFGPGGSLSSRSSASSRSCTSHGT